jgi:hypothetical protein
MFDVLCVLRVVTSCYVDSPPHTPQIVYQI